MRGFLAMAKMQAGNKPGMQQLADSLVLSGDGNTVALAFSIPTEVLDVLEGLAKGRHPADSAVRFCETRRAALWCRPCTATSDWTRCNIRGVGDHVFFYGTLMSPFNRPGRQRITPKLNFKGRGTIQAALFDLGIYPAAIPSRRRQQGVGRGLRNDRRARRCWPRSTRSKGYRPNEPERSLYTRVLTDVTLDDGRVEQAWTYFYNAPLGQAQRIASGDYLDHLNAAHNSRF